MHDDLVQLRVDQVLDLVAMHIDVDIGITSCADVPGDVHSLEFPCAIKCH
jgi:hypothetical protein